MGRDRLEDQIPDLSTTEDVVGRSANQGSDVSVSAPLRRAVLPQDLARAIKYLNDQDLDRLLGAAVDEAKRRGRLLGGLEASLAKAGASSTAQIVKQPQPTDEPSRGGRGKISSPPLTRGQMNAVRAAFKAGITPSRIARQFGLTQSDVRKALASDEPKR